jgi:hypothetical protein
MYLINSTKLAATRRHLFYFIILPVIVFGLIQCDKDRDGIPNSLDPTPNGSTNNKLNGIFTGGAARVVTITALDSTGAEDTTLIYYSDLTQNCGTSWYPQGTLCDESPTTNDPEISTKTYPAGGATWYILLGQETTGILVIDACYDGSCSLIDFNEVRIFQMFSDGKTTRIRLSIHPETGDTPPAWNDSGWQKLKDFHFVGAGNNLSGDGVTVSTPTVLPVKPSLTRYLLIEAQNDGSLGDGDYVELRAVKLFSVALR